MSIALSISTHTLTWSVTAPLPAVTGMNTISTHTLTWSVTVKRALKMSVNVYFNSHAHVERDHTHYAGFLTFSISTHTLTWSVTSYRKKGDFPTIDFNSHAHVERDRFF